MKRMRLFTAALAAIAIGAWCADAFAMTAKEIIDRTEKILRGDTQIAKMSITIKTRRWTRTMEMNSWDVRVSKKSFSEITAPKKDAGNRFLLLDKNMYQYNPDTGKTIKIAPSMMLQAWMGSDFTNDDIVKESSKVDDYTHVLDGKVTLEGDECYKITLTPKKSAAVVWGKLVYYSRVKDLMPVKQEFFNEHNVMKKVMTFGGYKKMDGRLIPSWIKMQTVGKEDRYTLMEIKSTKFNKPIPERYFTIQHLEKK